MGDWIEVQKKTFTKWANSYLRKRKQHRIEELYGDLQDGVKLINLVGLLAKSVLSENDEPLRYSKTPKMRIHRMENLKMAMDFMRKENVKMVNIGAEDILDRNEKIILATMWALIQRYSVDTVELDGISGKKGLLLWCQRQTKGYDGVDVKNFKESWRDGKAFLALLHRNGGRVDPSISDPETALKTAFACAEEQFELEPLIDAEDLLGDDIDEKVILTQLAAYFKEFANRAKGENLIKAVHTAIEVTRRHDRWIAEYGSDSKELKEWIASTTARYGNCREGADGHGDTTEGIKSTLDAFYGYKRADKPGRAEGLPSVGALLAKLHQSQKPNNRTPFSPASGHAPDDLVSDWGELEAREDAFEKSARESYLHFQRLEVTIEKFSNKHAKALSWLAQQTEIFEKGEFGDSVVACSSLLDNHNLFTQQFKLYKEGAEELRAMTTADHMELHAKSPELGTKMKELDDAIARTDQAGRQYHDRLTRNKKQYALLAQLQQPETWIARAKAITADPDVGTTMVNNTILLDRFKNVYTDEVGGHKQTVGRIEMLNDPDAPQQAGVKPKLETLNGALAELETEAKAYETKLLARQQELGELADQIKDFNSLCTEFLFAVDVLEEELAAPLHADSLQEAEALVKTFEEETQPATESIKNQFRQIDTVGRALYASKEPDAQSAFSQYDLNELNKRGGGAIKAILSYKQRLMGDENSFFAVEKAKEELRLKFAEIANKLKKYLTVTEAAVKANRGSLEDQIGRLEETAGKHVEKKKDLESAEPVASQLDDMGVINNPHTNETLASLQIQYAVLQKLIASSLATAKETLALNKQQAEWTAQYDAAAKELIAWIAKSKGNFTDPKEGKDGHGDTTASIKDKLDQFYTYKKTEKPSYNTKLANTKELLAELHASQRKSNRQLYVPSHGSQMQQIETSWSQLSDTEDAYETSIRDSYAHFQKLDGTIAKFTVKCTKIVEWLTAREQEFGKKDYGNSDLMVNTLLESFALFEQQMELYQEPNEPYDTLVNGAGMQLHQKHPELVQQLKELQAKLSEVNAAGGAHKAALDANAAEYKKLAKLTPPKQWMDAEQALFAKKEYGKNSVEVAHLITEFKDSYTNVLPKHRAELDAVGRDLNANPPSPHPKVAETHAERMQQLADIEREAGEYEAALLKRKKDCGEAVQLVKNYNAEAAGLAFACDSLDEELAVAPDAVDVKEAHDMVAKLNNETKPTLESLKQQLATLGELAQQLKANTEEETKTAFNRYKMSDLGATVEQLAAGVAKYEGKLAEELAEEQDKEALRVKFAEGAKAFKKHTTDVSSSVGKLPGDSLTDQLDALNTLDEKESPALKSELDALEPVAAKLEELGALDNAHTPETIYSLRGAHNALVKMFTDTRDTLENNIAAEKSGGLSPEQFKEIKEVFDHFDKSGDGQLDLTEFGTCTTAIGLVLSEDEIATHMQKLDVSGDGQLSFDEFIVFMKDQLTASGASAQDVLDAFREIAGPPAPPVEGAPVPPLTVSKTKIESSFVGDYADDAPYLFANMPQAESGQPAAAAAEGEAEGEAAPAPAEVEVAYLCEPFVTDLFKR
eukprot:g560.t1